MIISKKLLLTTSLLALSAAANAGYEIKIADGESITFGGFIKIDGRYVDGTVPYRDFWIGSGVPYDSDGNPVLTDKSQFKLFANETRFNTKYVNGDVSGFIEMDFYGGGGNEIISNSANPRIRHAFISYKDLLVGQTWSTFVNTSALAETADFAGPLVGAAFVRNTQIRYSSGDLQVSIENPESYGGDPSQDNMPDIIAKYSFKGDWGNISVAGLYRNLTTTLGNDEGALGFSVAGKVKTIGKDDIRFQIHQGDLGRYVGVTAAKDLVGEKVEESTSYMVAYRHFWNSDTRSSVFFGKITTKIADAERTHWGVNLFKDYTPKLAFGVEFGNYAADEVNADSNYFQLSAKYTL